MSINVMPDKNEDGSLKFSDTAYDYKGLDARLEGTDIFTIPADTTVSVYKTFDFSCKFNGIEIYAFNSNPGDKVQLHTEYYAPPLSAWLRYKKFGKNFNIFPSTLQKYVLFPTEPSQGVRLRIDYTNTSLTDTAMFSANLFQFIPSTTVNPSIAEQGEDW